MHRICYDMLIINQLSLIDGHDVQIFKCTTCLILLLIRAEKLLYCKERQLFPFLEVTVIFDREYFVHNSLKMWSYREILEKFIITYCWLKRYLNSEYIYLNAVPFYMRRTGRLHL